MRLARRLYYPYLGTGKAANIGDILFPMNGYYTNLEMIPDKYLLEKYGFNKDYLFDVIYNNMEEDFYYGEDDLKND